MHVNADYVVLEPVEHDGSPTPPGELSHTVLLTNLANAVQPIIRYDLGDRVREHVGPCPAAIRCRRSTSKAATDDILALRAADGRIVKLPPLAISTVVEDGAHIHRFQIVQDAADSLALKLCRPIANEARPRSMRCAPILVRTGSPTSACVSTPSEPQESRDGKLRQVVCRNRDVPYYTACPQSPGTT